MLHQFPRTFSSLVISSSDWKNSILESQILCPKRSQICLKAWGEETKSSLRCWLLKRKPAVEKVRSVFSRPFLSCCLAFSSSVLFLPSYIPRHYVSLLIRVERGQLPSPATVSSTSQLSA